MMMKIDFRRVLIALAKGAIKRRVMANDEGAIVGWATNENGEHYPIHEATGGGGGMPKSGTLIPSDHRKHNMHFQTMENGNVRFGISKNHPGRMWGTERGGLKTFLERVKKMGYTINEE